MSLVLNMTGGGGGKMPYAFLLVNHPSGATATATNTTGSKTISATQTLFYVMEGATACEVVVTDGTHTATKTITISYEGQGVIANVSFEPIYLIKNGAEQSGFSFESRSGNGTRVESGNSATSAYASITTEYGNRTLVYSANNANACYWLNQTIDLSQYSKLGITWYSNPASSSSKYTRLYLHNASASNIDSGTQGTNYEMIETTASETTVEIDLTSVLKSNCNTLTIFSKARTQYIYIKELYLVM